MADETKRIAYLLQRYASGLTTDKEEQELFLFIEQDAHADNIENLMMGLLEQQPALPKIDNKRWERILLKILGRQDQQGVKGFRPSAESGNHIFNRKTRYWFGAAAAIMLLLLAFGSFFLINRMEKSDQVAASIEKRYLVDFSPGGNQAMLTLESGESMLLDESFTGVVLQQSNMLIRQPEKGLLAYDAKSETGDQPVYHTLSTPRGGQYGLTLPDGTRVWLNAASSIRYPTAFSGKERRVELQGEAFFAVSPASVNKSASSVDVPFIVTVNGSEILVLGTQFNLSAYKDDNIITTTLLSGKVRVSTFNEAVELVPGQQAEITTTVGDGKKQTIRVSEQADMLAVTAWREGLFYFSKDDVQTIMTKIARWYDVEIEYAGEIPQDRFSGVISRNNQASKVLEMLELSGLMFETQGRTIRVLSTDY